MFSRAAWPICLLVCTCFFATFAKTERGATEKTRSIAVTGCLKEGNVLDRFLLRSPDGKAYSLRSSSVKLADHVGHRVSVRGALKHDPKRDDYDFEGSEVNEEYGKGKIVDPVDVEVSSLKVLATSCQ